jgi:hypothetical protein
MWHTGARLGAMRGSVASYPIAGEYFESSRVGDRRSGASRLGCSIYFAWDRITGM